MSDLNHFNVKGDPHMVNVGNKNSTLRLAIAKGKITMLPQTLALIRDSGHKKGDVIQIAQLAGIMGAKKTADLIPLCHPLGLDHIHIDIGYAEDGLDITAECQIFGKTGVEMEALTAVTVTALTIYDMCKAKDKAMVIGDVRLIHKSGGKSGNYDVESHLS